MAVLTTEQRNVIHACAKDAEAQATLLQLFEAQQHEFTRKSDTLLRVIDDLNRLNIINWFMLEVSDLKDLLAVFAQSMPDATEVNVSLYLTDYEQPNRPQWSKLMATVSSKGTVENALFGDEFVLNEHPVAWRLTHAPHSIVYISPISPSSDAELTLLNKAGAGSVMLIPLYSELNGWVGLVTVAWADVYEPEPETWQFYESLRVQLIPTVENYRAFDEIKRQVDYNNRLLNNLPVGLVVVNNDGKITEANPTLNQMTGYEEAELLTMPVEALLPDVTLSFDKQPVQFETTLTCHNKTSCPVRVNLVTFDDRGETGWLLSIADMTAQKHAEMEHRRVEERYRAVVEQQSELICRYNPELMLTFVNEAYCQFLGRSADQLVGQSFIEVIDEESRSAVLKDIHTYLENPRSIFNEHYSRRYDGALRWMQWTRQPIFDDNHNLIELQAVGRDLTEQKLAEEALSRSEQSHRHLIENSPDGIMITSQGVVRFANKALVKMLRADSAENLHGKSVFEIVHPDYHDLIESRITLHGHDNEVTPQRQERYLCADGTAIDVEIAMTSIVWDGTPSSLTFVRDITLRKQSEETLRFFQEQLKELHDLSLQLSKAESFDAFCHAAVEQGRERLGFDRLGLWFLAEDGETMIGSFGTDERGNTIDERQCQESRDDGHPRGYFEPKQSIKYWDHIELLNGKGEALGVGWNAVIALWNGDEPLGYLSADNLLNQQPASPQQLELLTLYGATLGYLTARKRAEDSLRTYQNNLKTLHQMGIDLSKAETFDTFCRQAVEQGREKLGFDRLGLWFLDEEKKHIVGSFGTGIYGETVDERGAKHPIKDNFEGNGVTDAGTMSFKDDVDIVDFKGDVLGRGWRGLSALWNGDEVIGYLSADSLLSHQRLSQQQRELLLLYGSTLGHLATRKRAEEALQNQRQAEQIFQEQLKYLNEVSIELSQSESFDDLCRQAVEMGVNQLGFDRMSLWFLDPVERKYLYGTYGVNEHGEIREEWGTKIYLSNLARASTRLVLAGEISVYAEDEADLFNERHEVIGKGTVAVTGLRDGHQMMGCIFSDNLFTKKPVDNYQKELLKLYGATIGHLAKRKWAEENLRRSEERYRAMFEGARVGICLMNERGYIVSPNPAFVNMLGYSPTELAKMRFADIIIEENYDESIQLFQMLIAGQIQSYQLEKRSTCKNGDVIWIRLNASLFPGETLEERLVIAMIEDITPMKQAENRLRESEARNRALLAAMPDLIFLQNREGKFIDYHAPSKEQLFTAPEHFLNKHISEVLPEDMLKFIMPRFEAALETGEMQIVEYPLPVGEKTGYFESRIVAYGDDNVLSIIRNVTQERLAREQLAESEERFRQIADNVDDVFFVRDLATNKTLYVNPAFEKIWQIPRKRLYEDFQVYIDSIHEDDRADFLKQLEYPSQEQEYRIVRPNGEIRWVWARYFAILNEAGTPYRTAGVIKDITERKRLETQNLELALQSERVKIISDFIRDASHEFRTPLSVINSKVYLATRLQDEAARQEQLDGIQEQSDVILRLVESLMTMSRLDSETPHSTLLVNLNDNLRALYENSRSRAQSKDITLKLELDHKNEPPLIPGDSEDVYQAFYNLVDNALRYTPAGGTITIRSQRQRDDQLMIEIVDTGSGIADGDLPHIFERFFRGDRAHSTPGFGLGLPMTVKIIEQYAGQVEVESQQGTGSTFRVYLPVQLPVEEDRALLT